MLFCLTTLVHVSPSSVFLVVPVMTLLLDPLLDQSGSGLTDLKLISIDSKVERIIGLGFLVHFAALSPTSTLISGGLQWVWQTWFAECVLVISLPLSGWRRTPTF